MISDDVHTAVAALCPIDGISFGSMHDKSTWRIDYRDEATAAQRQAVQQYIDSLDLLAAALAAAKAEQCLLVDAAAERARLCYITPGDGKAQVYQQKFYEAQAALVRDAEIDAMTVDERRAQFPLIESMMDIHGATFRNCRDLVLQKAAEWIVVAAQIEKIAGSGKASIGAALSEADAVAVREALTWPMP